MTRAMLFVDGSWLYRVRRRLREATGRAEYKIDYGLLPDVLRGEAAARANAPDLQVMRKFFVGSVPINVHPVDAEKVERQRAFYRIPERLGYDVRLGYVDFKGRRLKAQDRDREDEFAPEEKGVDVALATELVMCMDSYDVAILVTGDGDYVPALRAVISKSKAVVIAAAKSSCKLGLYDVPGVEIVLLDDLAGELERLEMTTLVECRSHLHRGDRMVLARWRPQNGVPFYCPECRREFKADHPGPLMEDRAH